MKKIATIILLTWGFAHAAYSQAVPDSVRNMEMVQWNVNHYARVYQTARGINDLKAAKEALLHIVVEIPQNDSLLFELGKVYFQLQEYAPASVCLNEIVKAYPDQLAAVEMAAISYENLGANKEALEMYESLYLNNDGFSILYKMVLLQFDLERFTEAMTNIDIMMDRPESKENKVPLMTTENQQKEYPMTALLLNLKGLIKMEQNENEAAKSFFEEALKIAPDFASAKEHLEQVK